MTCRYGTLDNVIEYRTRLSFYGSYISNKISRVVRNIMNFTSNIQEWFLWIRRGSADSIIKTTLDSTPMNLINWAPSQPNKLKAIYYYTCISNTSILVCCFICLCVFKVIVLTVYILYQRQQFYENVLLFNMMQFFSLFILMIWTYFIV